MNRLLIIFALVSLIVAGCKEPAPVQLEDEPDVFIASSIEQPDVNFDFLAIDTTGILPREQEQITGYVIINDVKFDAGQGVRQFAFSAAFLADRSRPVIWLGHPIGFFGLPVRSITLNGVPMVIRPHILTIRRQLRDTVHAGVEYVQDLSATYRPNQLYTWGIKPFLGDSFALPIHTPDELAILSPAGGSVVPRDRDLLVRWNGGGDLMVVVSGIDPATGRKIPFLRLNPEVNRGIGVVPARILRSMHAGVYALTFVLMNRSDISGTGGFGSARILVQAASVYTTIFVLR